MKTYTTKTAKNGATLYYSVETGKRIAKETALENERKEIAANGTVAERYELAKEFYNVTSYGGIETIGDFRISVPHGKSINHIVGGYTTKSRVQWHTISNSAAKIDLKREYNLTIDEFRAAALADKGFTAEQISQLLALRDDNETRLALTFSKMCEAFEAENATVTDEAETVNLDGATEIGDDTVKFFGGKFFSVFSRKYHGAIVNAGCLHYCVFNDGDTEVYDVSGHEVSYDEFMQIMTERAEHLPDEPQPPTDGKHNDDSDNKEETKMTIETKISANENTAATVIEVKTFDSGKFTVKLNGKKIALKVLEQPPYYDSASSDTEIIFNGRKFRNIGHIRVVTDYCNVFADENGYGFFVSGISGDIWSLGKGMTTIRDMSNEIAQIHINEQFQAARKIADKLFRVERFSQEQVDAVIIAIFDGNHDNAAVKKLIDDFKTENFNEAQKVAARIEEIIAAEIAKAAEVSDEITDGYDETAFDMFPTVDELNDIDNGLEVADGEVENVGDAQAALIANLPCNAHEVKFFETAEAAIEFARKCESNPQVKSGYVMGDAAHHGNKILYKINATDTEPPAGNGTATLDFSDVTDMFTPDLEPELTQSRLVPDNNVTVEEPDFSEWDAELEAEMKAELAEVETSLQELQTSLEIEISEGNDDNAQVIAERIVDLNARYGHLYEQIYGHTVEIFTDPAQVIADAIEITAIVDEEQRKFFDETVAEINADKEREIAAAVADTMNADAPTGWKITPTKSGNFQILHGGNVDFVDTITAGDYLNPKEFFDQFRQTREQEDDEREADLRQMKSERDQLIEMRDEMAEKFPDDLKRLRTLNEMIDEHEDAIAAIESLLKRSPEKAVDIDKNGNVTHIWF